jgi:hypothetical protein
MKTIKELNFGYNDAENYRRRQEKELFNSIFVRTIHLEQLFESQRYFLIGDKGTGKTAYAVYCANNFLQNTFCSLSYIRETDYQKFVTLKKDRHLVLSEYSDIWKVIILLLLSQRIKAMESSSPVFGNLTKFRNINKAVDEYYSDAFSPEIQYALNFVEESKIAADLISKYAGATGEISKGSSFSEVRFQTNLLYIHQKFVEALKSIKLQANHLLFIDGIDIRPSNIPYQVYLECIKGLANAVWELNNDIFANIKGSKGHLRVVLLIRPDIFSSLGLQNQNNKIRDNAVLLDWQTTYPMYRQSSIFLLADKLLSYQQTEELTRGQAWDYYFPFKVPERGQRYRDSFIAFLRYSLFRPRDLITMLKIMQQLVVQERGSSESIFHKDDFYNVEFRRAYSEYLFGEIRDSLSFYHSAEEYELFIKFFEYLEGEYAFTYKEYVEAYNKLITFIESNKLTKPNFFESADTFLQYLYELNVICYIDETIEGETWVRWCYRERSPANISPKIKTGARYEIHYGMGKAFNVGKALKRSNK